MLQSGMKVSLKQLLNPCGFHIVYGLVSGAWSACQKGPGTTRSAGPPHPPRPRPRPKLPPPPPAPSPKSSFFFLLLLLRSLSQSGLVSFCSLSLASNHPESCRSVCFIAAFSPVYTHGTFSEIGQGLKGRRDGACQEIYTVSFCLSRHW